MYGYPYCTYKEEYTVEKPWGTATYYDTYLDCYLTEYINEHDASEWPSFVVKGSDGVPFYYYQYALGETNFHMSPTGYEAACWVKHCYDETTGWWMEDRSYIGPFAFGGYLSLYYPELLVTNEELVAQTREALANGEVINGKAVKPVYHKYMDRVVDIDIDEYVKEHYGDKDSTDGTDNDNTNDTDNDNDNNNTDDTDDSITDDEPEGEIVDPYADVNTLGATVKLKTDCIKVKKNNKAQKPAPTSVKVGTKTLKKNKTYALSYEKYEDGWHAVDAVTDEGIYRMVITGMGGYEGVYKKRLYVTADTSVKAMSSATVKVNKVPYSGKEVTSGVIKSVKVGKRTLVEGVDYKAAYTNNLNSGNNTAQVKLTAIEGSGVLGTKTVNFTISGTKMSTVSASVMDITYDPNQAEQTLPSNWYSLVDTKDYNRPLTEGYHYTVSYKNNTKAGTAKIVFTGTGRYYGTLTKSFKIKKVALDDGMLDSASRNIEMTYTGKAQKPDVSLAYKGVTLVKGKDYTLTYSNNTKVSTDVKPAKITVTGKGNYKGTLKVDFTINPVEPEAASYSDAKAEKSVKAESVVEEVSEETEVPEEESVEEESEVEEESVIDESEEDEDLITDGESMTDEESVTDEESDKEDGSVEDKESVEDDESDKEEESGTEESVEDDESEEEEESGTEESEAEEESEVSGEESETEESEEVEEESEVVEEESESEEESGTEEESMEEESFTDEELEEISGYTGISVEELSAMGYDKIIEVLSDHTGITVEELKEMTYEEIKAVLKDTATDEIVADEEIAAEEETALDEPTA